MGVEDSQTICIPLMTNFIRDSSPEQSMLCSAIRRSVGVSKHDDEDCSTEISWFMWIVYNTVCVCVCVVVVVVVCVHVCVCTYVCVCVGACAHVCSVCVHTCMHMHRCPKLARSWYKYVHRYWLTHGSVCDSETLAQGKDQGTISHIPQSTQMSPLYTIQDTVHYTGMHGLDTHIHKYKHTYTPDDSSICAWNVGYSDRRYWTVCMANF